MKNAKIKRGCLAIVTTFLCCALIISTVYDSKIKSDKVNTGQQVPIVDIDNENVPLNFGTGKLVEHTKADTYIIPDKYNCGPQVETRKVVPGETIDGVVLRDGDSSVVLEFAYKNSKVSGTVEFNGIDFSDYSFAMYNEGKCDRTIHVIFNNCKFYTVKNSRLVTNISYEFNNCSFVQFYGSNATFNRCIFGHSYKDGVVPFQSITINDSYFCDLASTDPASVGLHSDGTQIYGYKDAKVENVAYNRCRFEVPAIQTTGNTASVNACIMFQLEYNDAINVSFNDCMVNGGGYSLYMYAFPGKSVENVSFNNIAIGSAHLFGDFHPNTNPNIVVNNLYDQSSLYVSSVWQDDIGTHIITSNDTDVDRLLKIKTDKGEYQYTVSACLGGKQLRYDNFNISFDLFPFDQDIVIPNDVKYVICYDSTTEEKQIRFESFDGNPVYIDEPDIVENITISEEESNEVIAIEVVPDIEETNVVVEEPEMVRSCEGSCGDSVSFSFLDGVLHIFGNGDMSNFNSSKLPPWNDFSDEIVSVDIGEGVRYIGASAFSKMKKLQTVSFPETLEAIGTNSFNGCSGLQSVSFPKSVKEIGRYAFNGTKLAECSYSGTQEEWSLVLIGDHNDKLLSCDMVFASEDVAPTSDIVMSGLCGDDVSFELNAEGVLYINGTGKMFDYNSSKMPPWSDAMDSIISIYFEDGVENVGAQSFRKAPNLSEVRLPDSLTTIGTNAFIGCSSLKSISFGTNVHQIGRYAFSGTGISEVNYAGNSEQWNNIDIGDHNDSILNPVFEAE